MVHLNHSSFIGKNKLVNMKLVIDTDTFSDTINWSILENVVDGLPELRSVKTTAAQIQGTNGRLITYDRYISFLYGATQSYYTQFSTRINSKGQKCTLYQHGITPQEITEDYDHHIDIYIRDFVINYNNLNLDKKAQKRTRLTPIQWRELSLELKSTWTIIWHLKIHHPHIYTTKIQPHTLPH